MAEKWKAVDPVIEPAAVPARAHLEPVRILAENQPEQSARPATSPTSDGIEQLRNVFRQIRDELGSFVERKAIAEGLVISLLAGHNVLLLGPPGTAKSLMAHSLCDRLDGGLYFQRLLTKFTTPEELFGPLKISGLKLDKFERATMGYGFKVIIPHEKSSYDSPWPQDNASGDSTAEIQGLPFAELDKIHETVAQAIQFTQAVRKTGLEDIFRTSTSINQPSYPPIMEKLAQIFGKDRDLLRILKLLGRLADTTTERRSKGVHPPTGELYDIQLGSDLEMVLPSELVLMSHPDAELDFFRRYSERSLMQYARRPEPEGRGPIYVCIDNSRSMYGKKNILAKAAALFSIKHAVSEKRDAAVVLFDEKSIAYDFPWKNMKVKKLAKLLNAPFGNGTRYRSGLEKCQTLMDRGVLKNADILLIGDAEEAPTEEDRDWFSKFHGWLGQTGTRLYSIHIGSSKDPLLRILRDISREVMVIETLPDVIPHDILTEMAEYFWFVCLEE